MSDNARRLAISAIVRIDEEGAYANVLLPKLLADAELEPRDKAFVTELVYGSTRMRRRLDHLVDRFLIQPPPPPARAALRVGAHQLLHLGTPPHAAVSATVDATPKRFRGLVNAVLRKVAGAVKDGVTYPSLSVELSYPDWILRTLSDDLGAGAAEQALRSMNQPAVVHVRDDGYVQDLSSQLVAAAVPCGRGDLVLDLCAAPGGKATALANRGARVIASDQRQSRAGLIVANRERLELDDLHVMQADATMPPFRPEQFDAVLIDAPCSGLGALRRRPDARWRISPGASDQLAALQTSILRAASGLVRPGGFLVYSVCTLTDAESVGVVAAAEAELSANGLGPAPAPEGDWEAVTDTVHRLLPSDAADGMSIARWQRH